MKAELSRARDFEFSRVGSLTPMLEADPPGELQLRSAESPSRIPSPPYVNKSHREWNAEQHTGEDNAKACHSTLPQRRSLQQPLLRRKARGGVKQRTDLIPDENKVPSLS